VLIYDRGGKGFAMVNSYSVLHRDTLDSPIVSASVNPEGTYAIVTNQTGYRSALTVWDKKNRQIFQWKTAQHYLLLSSVSPDGKRAAALSVGQAQGRPDYAVRVFDLQSGQEQFLLELGEDRVYSMKHYGSYLVLICDSSLRFYGSRGNLVCQVQFAQKPLLAWDHREGQLPLVALSGPEGAELYVWRPDGTKLLTRVLDTADLSACRYRGGTLAVLYGKKLLVASGDQYVIREVREVRDICLSAEGKVILVYSGKAGYFDPNISKEESVT
jgi:WD40 repeat protein